MFKVWSNQEDGVKYNLRRNNEKSCKSIVIQSNSALLPASIINILSHNDGKLDFPTYTYNISYIQHTDLALSFPKAVLDNLKNNNCQRIVHKYYANKFMYRDECLFLFNEVLFNADFEIIAAVVLDKSDMNSFKEKIALGSFHIISPLLWINPKFIKTSTVAGDLVEYLTLWGIPYNYTEDAILYKEAPMLPSGKSLNIKLGDDFGDHFY